MIPEDSILRTDTEVNNDEDVSLKGISNADLKLLYFKLGSVTYRMEMMEMMLRELSEEKTRLLQAIHNVVETAD